VAAHVNRRGWIVLTSIADADSGRCVDLFERPTGGFGFEEFRADPEDVGGWTAIGGHSAVRCATRSEAAARAIDAVTWLREQPRSRDSLTSWANASDE